MEIKFIKFFHLYTNLYSPFIRVSLYTYLLYSDWLYTSSSVICDFPISCLYSLSWFHNSTLIKFGAFPFLHFGDHSLQLSFVADVNASGPGLVVITYAFVLNVVALPSERSLYIWIQILNQVFPAFAV